MEADLTFAPDIPVDNLTSAARNLKASGAVTTITNFKALCGPDGGVKMTIKFKSTDPDAGEPPADKTIDIRSKIDCIYHISYILFFYFLFRSHVGG